MKSGIYLGIDFGDRRVGIAVSDWDKQIAFPRDFLEYRNVASLLETIKKLCQEEQVEKIILGLPIHMDGRIGERAEKTKLFGGQLEAFLPDIPVIYVDERLSTQYAVDALRKQGIASRDQKGKRDALSVQIVLQNYLNSLKKKS